QSSTYDHRTLNTGLPVRSALLKQRTGGLVVRWVTTGESPLLYVFAFLLLVGLNVKVCCQPRTRVKAVVPSRSLRMAVDGSVFVRLLGDSILKRETRNTYDPETMSGNIICKL
ncbi:hypothetical protein GQ44DRAFT_818229, partial [Phaeosphaeriaceae sp. PMI808]